MMEYWLEGVPDYSERFDVTLRSNPKTGYSWMLRTLPVPQMLVSTGYHQPTDCKAGVTGCGGDQIFSSKGVGTGTQAE